MAKDLDFLNPAGVGKAEDIAANAMAEEAQAARDAAKQQEQEGMDQALALKKAKKSEADSLVTDSDLSFLNTK